MEKIKVPWIFAALILGFLLATDNPFVSITSSSTFNFLAQLGMYFLLFVIGFEIDLNKLKKTSKFIFKATFFIILLEAFLGTFVVHFIFGYNWLISFVVALSFATVGEAILIPILDEFRIVNTKLGQSIIGIGTLDDIIEVFTLVLVISLVASGIHTTFEIVLILISLFILFFLSFGLTRLKEGGKKFNFLNIEILFLFVIFVLFLFLGIGEYAHTAPIAALISGIALKTFIPEKRLKTIESEVKTMCYGFFAPIFFLWVGISMNISYLISYPLLVLLVVIVSNTAKFLGSYIIGKGELGTKKSILLGIGLSARFSTSIVIVKILFENGLIGGGLYSVIVASSIIFTFIIPLLFSNLLAKWNIGKPSG
jgi:Ca2+-transporting ATPase